MRLSWSDIRWIYKIPRDVPLPEATPLHHRTNLRVALATLLAACGSILVTVIFTIIWRLLLTGNPAAMLAYILTATSAYVWLLLTFWPRSPGALSESSPQPETGVLISTTLHEHLGRIVRGRPSVLWVAVLACTSRPYLPALGLVAAVNLALTEGSAFAIMLTIAFTMMFTVLSGRILLSVRKSSRRLAVNTCMNCGYETASLPAAPGADPAMPRWVRCPECGELSPVHITAPTAAAAPSQL